MKTRGKRQGGESDAYGAKRTNLFMFDPDELVLVEDEKSTLYDERLERELPEAFILNIMHHGVLQPIVVRRNPDTSKIEVVAGRRRVRAAREANKRLKKQGEALLKVPATVRRGEEHALMAVMVSENEHREGDSPLVRARKVARYLELGRTEDEAAVVFGVGVSTIKNLLALLDAPKDVRTAVDSGRVSVTDGYKLAKLDPKEAKEKIAALPAPAQKGERRPREAARKAREVLGTSGVKGKKELRAKLEWAQTTESIKEAYRMAITATLAWALGDEKPLTELVG